MLNANAFWLIKYRLGRYDTNNVFYMVCVTEEEFKKYSSSFAKQMHTRTIERFGKYTISLDGLYARFREKDVHRIYSDLPGGVHDHIGKIQWLDPLDIEKSKKAA